MPHPLTARRKTRVLLQLSVIALLAVIAVGSFIVVVQRGDGPDAADGGTRFGVLASQCDSVRSRELRQAGISVVHVDLRWDLYHPEAPAAAPAYTQQVFSMLEICRDAGFDVVLGLGTQYSPEWVRDLPDGRFVDQTGASSESAAPNLMFSADARWAFETYVTEVVQLLPENSVTAIRVGTSEAGELGFPAEPLTSRNGRNSFWAYSDAAQTGNGLPDGMASTPMPGWMPGDTEWSGSAFTADDASTWFDWYTDSVARTVAWQIGLLQGLGFEGDFHLPLAGRGVLPEDRESAVQALLDGTGDRDASLERGLYYPDQLPALKDAVPEARIVADITGLGDPTAVLARSESPPTDTCRGEDAGLPLEETPGVQDWSASRWTIAVARSAGYPVMGENPGPSSQPGTGSAANSDPLRDQLKSGVRYAGDCGLEIFLFAFEDDLFAPGAEVPLSVYADTIRGVEG
ncbi:hypothetical protein [Arthrobacter sp. zg-Y877]|uniref:hypothetical protein n=1 Tax=Arthrobacter sp. zg-Y877 TaxID=3049074 RepID=UPI0025A34CE2|nr:hypothetical protein [Arthrobacter sp. zg-Y877]MDM7991136.1 hypothetical protein [Arthrobacter sp. zg-Y877]